MKAGKRARIIAESCNRSEILSQDIEAAISEWESYLGESDVLSDLRFSVEVSKEKPCVLNLPQFTDSFVNSANIRKCPVSVFPHWLVKDTDALGKASHPYSSLVSNQTAAPPHGLAEEARGILASKQPTTKTTSTPQY